MSYGNVTSAECRETKKVLKSRISKEKQKLKDFFELTEYIDMSWEARQQTIGSMYVNILGMKKRLKAHYGKK